MQSPRPARQGWTLQFASTIVLVCSLATGGESMRFANASETHLRGDTEGLSPDLESPGRFSQMLIAQAAPATDPLPTAPPALRSPESQVESSPAKSEAEGIAEQMRQAARRQRLNESLIRDREYSVLLADARRAFREQRHADGLQMLQTVLDAAHDVFLWEEKSPQPTSAKTLASRMITELTTPTRELYESFHGTDARLMWDDYQSSRDRSVLEELLRRYEHTRAGGQALRMSALSAMDRGEMASAHRLWYRLLGDPVHKKTLDLSDRLWIAVAARLSGQASDRSALTADDLQTPLVIGRETRTASRWLDAMTMHVPHRSRPNPQTEWTTAFGSQSGIRIDSGSAPSDRPLWIAGFAPERSRDAIGIVQVAHIDQQSTQDEVISRVAEAWDSSRAEDYESRATSNFALVVRDLVLVRTYSDVEARDLATGRLRWRIKCAGSLASVLSEPADTLAGRNGQNAEAEAAAIFEDSFAANSVQGMLSSDGEQVYFVDDVPEGADHIQDEIRRGVCNRLVAVRLEEPVEDEQGRVAWTFGDDPASERRYFLGPPLPIAGLLYVLAESADEVRLLCLSAADGAVRWQQPVSMVDRSLTPHSQRARRACCPTASDGVVVCPTQLGTVVGVDSTTGTLRWVYSYVDRGGPSQPWRGPRAKWRECGKAEFANLPLIAAGRVVLLPDQSDSVHCVDLLSGRPVWSHRPARDDSLYVATVDESSVMLVGPDSCRGLDVRTGELQWETRTPLPSGRGARIGDDYLLPTDDGRIVSIEVSTGRIGSDLLVPRGVVAHTALRPAGLVEQPFIPPTTEREWSNGNLLVCGDKIVVSSATGVAVFPQAQAALETIVSRLRDEAAGAEDYLRAAELQLRLGLSADARENLLHAAGQSPDEHVQRAVESHLRELLYGELASRGGSDSLFRELELLSRRSQDRARYLLHRLHYDLQTGNLPAAFAGAVEIWGAKFTTPIAMSPTGDFLVDPGAAAAAALARHRHGLPAQDAERFDELRREFARQCFDVIAPWDDSSASAVLWTRSLPQASAAMLAEGRLQDAELMLLDACRVRPTDSSAEAATELVDLWLKHGLEPEAVDVIDTLCRSRGGELMTDGKRLDAFLMERVAKSPDWTTIRHRMQRTARALSASIDEQHWPEQTPPGDPQEVRLAMETILGGNQEFYRTPGATRGLFRSGPNGAGRSETVLDVVDVSALEQKSQLRLPVQSVSRFCNARFESGHVAPVIGKDVVGVSLLEGRILWSIDSLDGSRGERAWLGPRGPRFCTIQAGATLAAVNPGDGSVLWVRHDLDHDCGLNWSDRTGIIGDDEVLVVFDGDGAGYSLLDPLSGVRLRTGPPEGGLDEFRKHHAAFGRKLLYKTRVEGVLRLRLWDPLSDELAIDESLNGRFLIATDHSANLITLLLGTRLTVFDAETGDIRFQTDCADQQIEGVQNVSVFQDRDRTYVHLKRSVQTARLNVTPANLRLPNAEIGGELFVVDRASGEFWSKTVLPGRLLLFHHQSLPLLVTVSRVRENQQNPVMKIDIFDAATGELLAQRDDLTRNTLVHAAVDKRTGRIVLSGMETRVTLSFQTAEGDSAAVR